MTELRDRLDTPHVHDATSLLLAGLQAYLQLSIIYWLVHGKVVTVAFLVVIGISLELT